MTLLSPPIQASSLELLDQIASNSKDEATGTAGSNPASLTTFQPV